MRNTEKDDMILCAKETRLIGGFFFISFLIVIISLYVQLEMTLTFFDSMLILFFGGSFLAPFFIGRVVNKTEKEDVGMCVFHQGGMAEEKKIQEEMAFNLNATLIMIKLHSGFCGMECASCGYTGESWYLFDPHNIGCAELRSKMRNNSEKIICPDCQAERDLFLGR